MKISRRRLATSIIAPLGSGLLRAPQGPKTTLALAESRGAIRHHSNIHDWPMHHRDSAATRNASNATLSSKNVNQLRPIWRVPLHATSSYGAVTSNPIVVNGSVYLVDQECNISSFNITDGGERWTRVFSVPTSGPNGIAVVADTLVSVLGDECEVAVIDRYTGKERWRKQIEDSTGVGITTSPMIYEGKILVGTAVGGNSDLLYHPSAHGALIAIDLDTSETAWKWSPMPEDGWGRPDLNGGCGIWQPPSISADGKLFIGTGNPTPFPGTSKYPNAASRKGRNDYANSVVCLDAATGSFLWAHNMNPADLLDHDNHLTPVLADVPVGSDGSLELVVSSGKHGTVAALNRADGSVLWKVAVGKHLNDTISSLPTDYIEVYPGIFGGVLSPMATDGCRVFVAALNFPSRYNSDSVDLVVFDSAQTELLSIDLLTGEIVWRTFIPSGVFGSGPTIASDVVFVGTVDGLVRGYSKEDGSLLWAYQCNAGINAPTSVANDVLLVAAGSFIVPSVDRVDDGSFLDSPELVAFSLESANRPKSCIARNFGT